MSNEYRFTLSNVISGRIYDKEKGWTDCNIRLTEAHKNAFVEIFGKRCSEQTKRRLKTFINYPKEFANHGIYERVVFDHHGQLCHYVTGQSYPDEIRTIRKLACKQSSGLHLLAKVNHSSE
jgi:hypothetical protein